MTQSFGIFVNMNPKKVIDTIIETIQGPKCQEQNINQCGTMEFPCQRIPGKIWKPGVNSKLLMTLQFPEIMEGTG